MPSSEGRPGDRLYLLVFEGDSSRLFGLPRDGIVQIGRAPDVDLRLGDPTASRRHAKLMVTRGQVTVMDQESHNGTRVNGVPVDRPTAVFSGDIISICDVTLVLHAGNRVVPTRALCDAPALRQRLEEELQRALEYERPLTVLVLALRGLSTDGSTLATALGEHLRLMDVAGWSADTHLMVLLPEFGADEARAAAEPLLEALAPLSAEVAAGFATFPEDGADADTLLSAARSAATTAPRGPAIQAADAATRLSLEDRTVVVAEPAMLRLYELLRRLAASDLSVLISGETGAGKENAAFAVHHWSARSGKPFVTLNCAAIHESLVESELFGHERGAFTGAVAAKTGLLEAATGGTVFLDEIAELPPSVQSKLLRALESKRITRVGDIKERSIDIRIVAATHRDLSEEVREGRFRQDLFFRLSAARVVLPPLRERHREIPILARDFLRDACERLGRAPLTLSAGAMQALTRARWEGNVRELKNAMEFVAATVSGSIIEPWHLPGPGGQASTEAPSTEGRPANTDVAAGADGGGLDLAGGSRTFRKLSEEIKELERRRMEEALEASGGVQTRAAELIGMPLRTFTLKVKQYALSPREAAKGPSRVEDR